MGVFIDWYFIFSFVKVIGELVNEEVYKVCFKVDLI